MQGNQAPARDPFEPGDVLWFEKLGRPTVVFIRSDDGSYRTTSGNKYTFEQVLMFRQGASGPYRVAQTENWSGYDFTTHIPEHKVNCRVWGDEDMIEPCTCGAEED